MNADQFNERIKEIIRHIRKVEDNCNKLANSLPDEDLDFALKLVQLGRIHDASKFNDFEFKYLGNYEAEKPVEFFRALKIHHSLNPHHPEYWSEQGGINEMPSIYLAEMVCDCLARGQEFGTNTRIWFSDVATKKYNFSMENDNCGILITKYLDLLLSKPF